jgi:DNA-binding CsgD family transcriptional regulator
MPSSSVRAVVALRTLLASHRCSTIPTHDGMATPTVETRPNIGHVRATAGRVALDSAVRNPWCMAEPVAEGRRSFERLCWRDAYDQLRSADRLEPLGVDDLERLAVAAYLVGELDDCMAAWTRAFAICEREGDALEAARHASWLAFVLLLQGEMAPASGWMARVRHLIDDAGEDCVARGLLKVHTAVGHLFGGDASSAVVEFTTAMEIGSRFGDRDVETLGRFGLGQALLASGIDMVEGVSALDEAMVAVTAGEVSPVVAGLVYCGVIETCHLMYDIRRAHEWTAALSRWCDSQPDLVPYRGQCLVHRAEILQFHGSWPDAVGEAERAFEQLSSPPAHPAVGDALYRLAELRRLRGEFSKAEEFYSQASERGREPQPGLALLRLGQGQIDAAAGAIRRALEEAADRTQRAPLLGAYVEIMVAAGDVDAARRGASDLARLANELDVPVLRAMCALAEGSVGLAEGDPGAALSRLRTGWLIWRELEAPYEAARARIVIGQACRMMGDEEGTTLEWRAAKRAFRELGAVADVRQVDRLLTSDTLGPVGQLTDREREVLALVATGMTNRAIAGELVISERTVARHVANIFAKLGVSSRAAATAFAYEQGLTR